MYLIICVQVNLQTPMVIETGENLAAQQNHLTAINLQECHLTAVEEYLLHHLGERLHHLAHIEEILPDQIL